MKAVHIKPGKIVEYFGEMHITEDTRREVKILQFVKSFWGSKAICKVGTVFEEIPVKELEMEDIEVSGKMEMFHTASTKEGNCIII